MRCLPQALWGPTWFSVAGWHSSNRIPNALGVAFLFFLIMLMPQGVLGAATLSSGMNSGKESWGQLEEARRVPHIQYHTHTLGYRDFIKELGRLKITRGERRLRGQGNWPPGRRSWLHKGSCWPQGPACEMRLHPTSWRNQRKCFLSALKTNKKPNNFKV